MGTTHFAITTWFASLRDDHVEQWPSLDHLLVDSSKNGFFGSVSQCIQRAHTFSDRLRPSAQLDARSRLPLAGAIFTTNRAKRSAWTDDIVGHGSGPVC